MTRLNDTDDEKTTVSETQYLLNIPGMKESIVEGMEEDLAECSKDLDW